MFDILPNTVTPRVGKNHYLIFVLLTLADFVILKDIVLNDNNTSWQKKVLPTKKKKKKILCY